MQREELLLAEMIDAAEQAVLLVGGADADAIERDRRRRDAASTVYSTPLASVLLMAVSMVVKISSARL